MALAKRNEGANVNSDINVTPMVDVMLVLLIIFMVVTPMLQHGVSVDMAKVNNPTSRCRTPTRKTRCWLRSCATTKSSSERPDQVDDLTQKIKDRWPTAPTSGLLKADMRAKFGWVVEVVDNVRAAGVDQLGLLTDQKKAGTWLRRRAPPTDWRRAIASFALNRRYK
jgi:biopolymer transport protein TolR